jgi:hypothetical protein
MMIARRLICNLYVACSPRAVNRAGHEGLRGRGACDGTLAWTRLHLVT